MAQLVLLNWSTLDQNGDQVQKQRAVKEEEQGQVTTHLRGNTTHLLRFY